MRRSRTWLVGTVAAVAAAVTVATVPPALADRHDQQVEKQAHRYGVDLPGQDQVDAAEADAAQKARDVAAIKARLLLANQRLEQASLQAEQAAESYNGARWRLDRATQALKDARADAARARATVAEQRDRIAALVTASYQQASDLSSLGALMGADGPEGVLDQYAAFQGASTSMQADYKRFAAADALAQVFEHNAAEAKAKQERVAEQARAARAKAAAAADAAQTAATQIAAEKDELIRELAKAQDISVALARKRQAALEEIAQKRAAERARQEALAAARAEARAKALAEAKARREARREAAAKAAARAAHRAAAEERRNDQRDRRPAPAPKPVFTPAPKPQPQPRPAPSSGDVSAVLGFAKAQLGEPYQWGAAGPDAWDCSGLTMGAWGAAGVYLPHYTVAQYYASTPISVGELRPGDLVFWSSTGSPEGIHHVAIYLGDGMIIHAPRTGRPVEIDSMYYWIPPTHFARP